MADAGIPDPPGRDDAIKRMKELKPYRATFRDNRSWLVRTERIMAVNFKDALNQARAQGSTVLSVLEDW